MKCLPSSSLIQQPPAGNVLHDCHAEVLAMRLLSHFLIHECLRVSSYPAGQAVPPASPFIRRSMRPIDGVLTPNQSPVPPFEIKDGWKIRMYCSEAPCGDASMELTMRHQADATPWPITFAAPVSISSDAKPVASTSRDGTAVLKGRASFSELGIVRRKPARANSPPTSSKSCTDKLATKQCTSLLSSVASLLISPRRAYLDSLIIPRSQHVRLACDRAFGPSGRMAPLAARKWNAGYEYRPFELKSTDREFRFSRRAGAEWAGLIGVMAGEKSKASNMAAGWNPYVSEVIIGGILQGRKKGDPRGASAVSRRKLVESVLKVAGMVSAPILTAILKAGGGSGEKVNYRGMKDSSLLQERRKVKETVILEALPGWVKNVKDDFQIEQKI